jgi:predicted O-methyltransferase YrrM
MTNQCIRRRDFIRTAGAAGTAGLLSGLGPALGAESAASPHPASASSSPPPETIITQLEAIAREFVTLPKEEGQFLNLLVKLTRAQHILEIGTGYGYTTIWLALALEETGGHLTTIEIVSERVELAKKHVAKAGLSHRVSFKQGDAHTIVPTLAGPFDIAYLDADKDRQVDYFNKLFPTKLPPGGLLIAHNAILRADAMKDYLELVRHHPAFDTLNVSATPSDAFALSYRRRPRR